MITHHEGAVTMVEELLEQPGSAYDPVLFEFANDVENDQTAEIERMHALLITLSDDPRAGLAAGFEDAGQALMNLELVASMPKPPGFYDPGNPAGLPPERPRDEDDDEAGEDEDAEDGDNPGGRESADGRDDSGDRDGREADSDREDGEDAGDGEDGEDDGDWGPLAPPEFLQLRHGLQGRYPVRRQLPRFQYLPAGRSGSAAADQLRRVSGRAGRPSRSSATC